MSTEQKNTSAAPAPTHHFGRGGAGNKTAKDPKSPALVPEVTPVIKENVYTTGRGGTGNMAKLDPSRPEEARAAQDADIAPEMMLPEGPQRIGRGGAANVHLPTEEERIAAQKENERARLRRESGSKERTGLKGLADKGKELLGKKKPIGEEK